MKGPKFSRQTGITPIMEAQQMRLLLDPIRITRQVKVVRKHGGGLKEVPHIKGLRDRAAIAIMAYTFARVSAVVGVKRGDYRMEGKRARLRLLEKGNKEKLVWLHHEAEQYLDAYLEAAGIETRRRRYFRRWIRRTGSRARPSPGATCCVWLRTAAGPRGCRRSSATIHSGEPALRYFCITAGHSKLPRTWRIIPIRGQPSYMIEGKDLATLSEIERRIAFE